MVPSLWWLKRRQEERMKDLFEIAVVVLSIPVCLLSQTGVKPLPAKWLHEGRLVVPEFSFSINSPSADAKWSYKPKVDGSESTIFIVAVGDGSKYVVNVIENSKKSTSTNPDQFIIGMRETLPKGWQIQDTRFEVSDVPLKESRKFRVAIGLPNGTTYYSYGYIISGNTTYQAMTFSTSPTEPLPFRQFARSFTLLRAKPAG